jgi:YesN/AraC family two-component response regulator
MFTMLVVDDERLLADGMKRTIDETGLFQTFSAGTGLEALKIIEGRRIDAMLLDIAMPEMSGIELMRRLMDRPDRPATIILSGYDEFDYAKEALSYGAADYVLKPVDQDDVRAMARRLHELAARREERDRLLRGAMEVKNEGEAPRSVAEQARRAIDKGFANPDLGVNNLSEKLGYSPNYLGNAFKRAYGLTIADYIGRVRVAEAKRLMDQTDLMIYEIAFRIGFEDQHYFSKTFKKYAGVTPSEYRENKA